jgi:hypothetical protein
MLEKRHYVQVQELFSDLIKFFQINFHDAFNVGVFDHGHAWLLLCGVLLRVQRQGRRNLCRVRSYGWQLSSELDKIVTTACYHGTQMFFGEWNHAKKLG